MEERHHLQTLEDRLGAELDLVEDRGVGPERDGRPRPVARRRAGHPQRAGWLATIDEGHLVAVATAVDLQLEPRGQRVHDRHANAVKTPGDLVAGPAELAASVQDGEDDLGRGLRRLVRVRIDGYPPAVVHDPTAAVGPDRDVDPGAVTLHRLVDRVVDDLPDEVMQPARRGRTDEHARPEADRLKPTKDGDVGCFVRFRGRVSWLHLIRSHHGRGSSTAAIPTGRADAHKWAQPSDSCFSV